MARTNRTCCGTKILNGPGGKEPEIPAQIQNDLDERGGFDALAGRIPSPAELEEKSRVHHALADPLRLTILHLVRDQPLCVCVINRFMRLPGPKLSYHLNILKEAGLIGGEYQGNWIIYSLTETGREYLR